MLQYIFTVQKLIGCLDLDGKRCDVFELNVSTPITPTAVDCKEISNKLRHVFRLLPFYRNSQPLNPEEKGQGLT